MTTPSQDFIQRFQDLSMTSLSEVERDELQRSLKTYQRTHDLAKLAKACSPLLLTNDRAGLLHYIRAPMMMPERLQFDRLLGVHDKAQANGRNDDRSLSSRIEVTSCVNPPPANPYSGPERYVTIQGTRGKSMGFSIRGGSEFGLGIYVSAVRKRSPSGEAGLRVGDQILSTNGVDFTCVANSGAVKVLSSSAVLHLKIQRCGKVPEWKIAKQRVLWYDVALCKVVRSPPVTECEDLHLTRDSIVEQKVILNVSDNSDYIGLNIRGGVEYGIGVYVSRVDPGGLAHKAGISAGDQISRVNDVNFLKIEHSDAVDVLRSSSTLILTIKSVGKYPVFKELCAEYSWSSVGNIQLNKTSTAELNKRRIQRTRARESSVDLSPYRHQGTDNPAYDFSDVEELDDGLQVQAELCCPKENDVTFKRNYEDSWRQIDDIDEYHLKSEEGSKSWAADFEDSLGYYNNDSDMSDSNMDYTSFLEKNKQQITNGQNLNNGSHIPYSDDDNLVIETVIEEEVTSFGIKKQAPQPPREDYVTATTVSTSFSSNYNNHPVGSTSPQSVKSYQSSSSSSVNLGKNKYQKNRKGSLKNTPAPAPPNASVVANGNNNSDVDNITSQIKQLEARKSHLGTWEITRVAGSSSSSVPSSPDLASDSEKSKSTWSTFKNRIKGSLRKAGSKKRMSLPTEAEFTGRDSPSSPRSLHQKGVFERSFGSQILNNQGADRYNLMAVLEDHARKILSEDECKAVLRHINNYHENRELERLVQLLLAILDKSEKQVLLIDVRGVIHPSHLEKYDNIMDRCHIQGYNTQHWAQTNLNSVGTVIVQKQPAPPIPTVIQDTNEEDDIDGKSDFNTYSREDFKNEPDQLELIILEKDERNDVVIPKTNDNDEYEDFEGVETVYISKHKSFLGLELCGGQENHVDKVIRVKEVQKDGAASDDRRIQPGLEIVEIDGNPMKGLTVREAEVVLHSSFRQKSPVNLGIEIRHSFHL